MKWPGGSSDYYGLIVEDEGTVSACGKIDGIDEPNAEYLKEEQDPLDIPSISISTLTSDITFESIHLPSGTYSIDNSVSPSERKLTYKSDISDDTIIFSSGSEIIPGAVRFNLIERIDPGSGASYWEPRMTVSKNIQVEYDPNQEYGTGNVTIENAALLLEDGVSIYAPGNSSRDVDAGSYTSGNIIIDSYWSISGKGNIYTMGELGLDLGGEIGYKIPDSKNDNVALYAQGDIEVNGALDTFIRGLIYTNGDFIYNSNSGLTPDSKILLNSLTIEGALIAAGKDPNDDPEGYDPGEIEIKVGSLTINFDDTVLDKLNSQSFFTGGGAPPAQETITESSAGTNFKPIK